MHFMLWHHITLFDTEQSINFKNNCHIFCSTYQDNNCLSGFASEEDITTKARMITTVDGSYLSSSEPDRLYKDIHFTCDGNITQLVIGAKNNIGKSSNPPEVRFWRNSGGIYTQSESVINYTMKMQLKFCQMSFQGGIIFLYQFRLKKEIF